MKACETASKTEPAAISVNRAKSFFEDRDEPTAMFDEIETAARRSWFVRPKRSYLGNARVSLYMRSAKSMAFCQTSSFSKLNIGLTLNSRLRTLNFTCSFSALNPRSRNGAAHDAI